jgi:hypothetical protein
MRKIYYWNAKTMQMQERPVYRPPDVNAPFVQGDEIPPTISHATDEGRVFESRSALYAHYKEHGFECTGGDHMTGRGVRDYQHRSDINEIRADLHEQARQIKWGMAPCNEKQREIWNREERNYENYRRSQRG